MFRSIQIFELSSVLNSTKIRDLFEKKSFKYEKKHKRTNEPIELDVIVTDFKDEYNPKTVHIDFMFYYQFRVKRDTEDDYVIAKDPFHVIIFPKEKLLILLGSGNQRNQFLKILRQEIENKSDCKLQSVKIPIPKMMIIFKNIQKESLRNNIRSPKFYFDKFSDFDKKEDSMYSVFPGTCASKIDGFEDNKSHASKMDLSLRIVKCTGLIPIEIISPYILHIVHDGRMSITVNVEPKQWAKFIYEKVYPILG